MTEEQLTEIEARARAESELGVWLRMPQLMLIRTDIPLLLAEVRRLRGECERLRGEAR